jgi:hypothetical protein
MHHMPRAAAILLLAAGAVSCQQNPIGPQPQADPIEAALALTDRQEQDYQPLLPRLFRQALTRIARTDGPDVAKSIADEIKRIHEAAATAQAAGDLELARRLREEVKLEMARVVVRVFGTQAVDRVLHFAHGRLGVLEARIRRLEAGGIEVPPGMVAAARSIRALLADARAEYAGGNSPQALVLGADAVNLLARVRS